MVQLKPLDLQIQKSPHSVATTQERLKKLITAKGMIIFAEVDHSEEAHKARMNLNEEKLLIFGDPKVGTFLMQENPLIGMELPIRILIWQDDEKVTQIAYIDPLTLGQSYNITKNIEILRKISSALSVIVSETIQSTPEGEVKI
jgi:uncharacterized protein (DUF302 family)